MRNLYIVTVVVAGILGLNAAHASIPDRVYVKGMIKDILKQHVVLKTEMGKIRIPRKYFNERSRYFRSGKTVRVQVSLSEVADVNQKYIRKNKKVIHLGPDSQKKKTSKKR